MTARKLSSREHYAVDSGSLVLRQNDATIPGPSLGARETTLQVRRVLRQGADANPPIEELQIEIRIDTRHKTRTTSAFCSFIVPPELADELAKACSTVINPMRRWEDARNSRLLKKQEA